MAVSTEQKVLAPVIRSQPKSPVSEAFRTLRTNIKYASVDRPLKSILFTSPAPSEGKSTVTANFALTLAQAGYKVLLVDCDMRKPVQHKIFSLKNHRGLTNILVEGKAVKELVNVVEPEGLELLTTGPIPPNPAELLGSARMASLLGELGQSYDMVILDTPPVIAVTDAVLLAPQVSGVVLVLKAGTTLVEMAREAKEQLERVNARILGVVLNGIKRKGSGYYHYYYYYYGND
ncbi:CpsD/CapB family tyrosine-protein kinase [Thermanaeromonas sp. C210]|uniref:CpsD/CapB family tyrosine-protein kinase n=1 Tax=Thermanaeromonas sp. C210 TaxID=2731925 RepID=UPI00155D2951|nr:CpsD/CapB family tyrosine-protein kinase [Thermanaeromonas sp. C210]GFN23701.1 tyrosine protein kinase [Thermanaeromonas sp. C210]